MWVYGNILGWVACCAHPYWVILLQGVYMYFCRQTWIYLKSVDLDHMLAVVRYAKIRVSAHNGVVYEWQVLL